MITESATARTQFGNRGAGVQNKNTREGTNWFPIAAKQESRDQTVQN